MNIVYKTPEAKKYHVEYEEDGNRISFEDESLMINLSKYEADDPRHIDITRDWMGNLTMGVQEGVSKAYVAQIDIPARSYHMVESEEYVVQDEEPGQVEGMEESPAKEPAKITVQKPEADAFDMSKVTLTLWEV